jgi:hypothetical protein
VVVLSRPNKLIVSGCYESYFFYPFLPAATYLFLPVSTRGSRQNETLTNKMRVDLSQLIYKLPGVCKLAVRSSIESVFCILAVYVCIPHTPKLFYKLFFYAYHTCGVRKPVVCILGETSSLNTKAPIFEYYPPPSM